MSQMKTYWLSFRIADDATYDTRYERLLEAIHTPASKCWLETTAFIIFSSSHDIDALAARVKGAINATKDIAVIGMPDFKSARILGASQDDDIFALMPFIKSA
jgi:hypothetical protein